VKGSAFYQLGLASRAAATKQTAAVGNQVILSLILSSYCFFLLASLLFCFLFLEKVYVYKRFVLLGKVSRKSPMWIEICVSTLQHASMPRPTVCFGVLFRTMDQNFGFMLKKKKNVSLKQEGMVTGLLIGNLFVVM
jgi:hypothetical protein